MTEKADEVTISSATLKGLALFANAQSPAGEAWFYYSTNAETVDAIISKGTKVNAGTIPIGSTLGILPGSRRSPLGLSLKSGASGIVAARGVR